MLCRTSNSEIVLMLLMQTWNFARKIAWDLHNIFLKSKGVKSTSSTTENGYENCTYTATTST